MPRDNLVAVHQDGNIVSEIPLEVRSRRDVDLVQHNWMPLLNSGHHSLHRLAEVASCPREERQFGHVWAICCPIWVAAVRGSGAAVIGRPTTR